MMELIDGKVGVKLRNQVVLDFTLHFKELHVTSLYLHKLQRLLYSSANVLITISFVLIDVRHYLVFGSTR